MLLDSNGRVPLYYTDDIHISEKMLQIDEKINKRRTILSSHECTEGNFKLLQHSTKGRRCVGSLYKNNRILPVSVSESFTFPIDIKIS